MNIDFGFLRKSVQSIAGQRNQLREQIEQLQRERENIANAPATREDVKAMVKAWADGRRAEYAKRLAANMTFFIRKADRLADPAMVQQRMSLYGVTHSMDGLVPGPALNDMAICALLGDKLVPNLYAVLDDMEWPAGAMPMAGRSKRIEEIDKELGKLTRDEEQLRKSAREAGIVFEE